MAASVLESAGPLQSLSDSLASAVERAAPSVVAVHGRPRVASSGVLWRPGVVVTAAHTVRRDGDVGVTLGGGRTVSAAPAGRDAATDLAVFRIGASDGASAQFAPAGTARIGQAVLQVGRTGDAGHSASFGVISAMLSAWRTWRGAEIEQLLELDLAIHLGFSGSALVDAAGRVLGLNTSGLARGVPLALPAPVADRVVETLLARGRVTRGYLGAGLQPVDLPASLATGLSLDQRGALIVLSVDPDGPAATAGLQLGDVLVRAGGAAIADIGDLLALLSPERVGTTLEVEVVRAGALVRARVSVGERQAK